MGSSWPPVPGLWSLPPSSSPPSVLLDGSSSEYSKASGLSWFLFDDVQDLFLVGFSYLMVERRLLRVEIFRYATDELWIPSTSEFKSNKAWKNEHFAKNTRFAYYCWVKGKEKPQSSFFRGWGGEGGFFLAWVSCLAPYPTDLAGTRIYFSRGTMSLLQRHCNR